MNHKKELLAEGACILAAEFRLVSLPLWGLGFNGA